MPEKTSLRELIERAQKGDNHSILEIIGRFKPTIKKYASMTRAEDAYSNLVLWTIEALKKYRRPTDTESGCNR